MNRLQLDEHSTRVAGGLVVEIHHPERGLIGVIYPTDHGVRIVSKYLDPRSVVAAIDPVYPPALEVTIL